MSATETTMSPGLVRRSTTEGFVAMKSESITSKKQSTAATETPIGNPLKRIKASELTRSSSESQIAGSLVRHFVVGALDEKAQGKQDRYKELVKRFTIAPTSDGAATSTELRMTINALAQVPWQLDKSCSDLVLAIVRMQWLGRDLAFVNDYTRFLGTLVSAHSSYMEAVVNMLVESLTLLPISSGRLPNHPRLSRVVLYERAHAALRYMIEVAPTAAFYTLSTALAKHLPHEYETKLAHTVYLANLLRVVEYAPQLRNKTVQMFVQKLIQVDVAIQGDLDELEEEFGDEDITDLGETMEQRYLERVQDNRTSARDRVIAELEQQELETEDDDSDEEDEEVELEGLDKIRDTVSKLDLMLDLVFEYYDAILPSDEESGLAPSMESCEAFDIMLSTFDQTILPTHQSRFTQFLVFWGAQKSPIFVDMFLGMLITLATDGTKPQTIRQAGAAYASSFISRAKCMDTNSIQTVVQMLCSWLNNYLISHERACKGADLGKYAGFYAVVQAVMYIFCFRWRQLKQGSQSPASDEEIDEGEIRAARWIPELRIMERAITSRFNPLKVCSQDVVEQFAEIAHYLDFMYCYSIIEKNNRTVIDRYRMEQLDAYFPFDPYKLRKSKRWVEDVYVPWKPIKGMEESGYESDEGSEDDDEHDEDDDEEDGDIGDEEMSEESDEEVDDEEDED
jgi:RNA polymerase I-specific transcription initiation factor RRN3